MESKVEAIMALSALLQGPFEIGSHILSRTGVLEMIMAMAESDNAMHVVSKLYVIRSYQRGCDFPCYSQGFLCQ